MKTPSLSVLIAAVSLFGSAGCTTPQSANKDDADMRTYATHFTIPVYAPADIAAPANGGSYHKIFDSLDTKFLKAGKAVVTFVVMTDGSIAEPQVQAATDKALGLLVCGRAKDIRFKNPARLWSGQVVNSAHSIMIEVDNDGRSHVADLAFDRNPVAVAP